MLRLNLNSNAPGSVSVLALGLLGAACATAVGPGAGSAAAPAAVERRLAAMGTWLGVEVEAADRGAALQASEAAYRAIRAVEQRLSTWIDTSELARANAAPIGQPTAISVATGTELARAFALAEHTGGAFSPAVGPLVDAYALRDGGRWPGPEERESARAASALDAWRTEPGEHGDSDVIVRLAPDARLEEGGWAKGAGLDAARAVLEDAGVRAAHVDLGGQILRLGSAVDDPVEISDPRDRERAALRVDCAHPHVATSSNAVRGVVVDGRPLPHLLDPRDGAPAAYDGSVTVLAGSGLEADALATALFVLGPEAGLAWCETVPDVEAVFLTPDDRGLLAQASRALSPHLEALVPDLRLAR